jgi:hypothetical protein
MTTIPEPVALEMCMGTKAVERYPYPLGHRTTYGACLERAQSAFRIYWHRRETTLFKVHPNLRPYPDSVRVVAADGTPIASWSIDDELRGPAAA